jgi:hypothetical protein
LVEDGWKNSSVSSRYESGGSFDRDMGERKNCNSLGWLGNLVALFLGSRWRAQSSSKSRRKVTGVAAAVTLREKEKAVYGLGQFAK